MKRRAKGVWKQATAIAALLGWMGGLALCSADPWLCQCAPDQTHEEHGHSPTTAESHQHGENDNHTPNKAPHENGFCSSLKAAYFSAGQSFELKPQLVCVGLFSSLFLLPESFTDSSKSVSIRQFKRAIWVFTPEVCLGPAFRSLAPPVWT